MNSSPPSDGSAASISAHALQAIRDLKAELQRRDQAARAPIAIIGMGCRFPGAEGLEAFWDLLLSGRDPIAPIPDGRWDPEAFYSPDPAAPGKVVAREAGYVDHLDRFDASFFGISPREAVFIDPRQRLTLETGWEALEDAGVPPRELAGSQTGVFMGVLTNDYNQLITSDPTWISASTGTGAANSIIANRLSYFLDLRGPSIALDTACASSLVAIHLACKSLREGESCLALAGGVTLNLVPSPDISFSRMGALAPYARCATFDADAAGMIRSDGAGMIVLKRLEDALADGDRVHAVIRGSTVNHDGRSNGIASPNGRAQVALLRDAYREIGVSPGQVQYIEAHGTGTTVGDAIEIQALTEVLGQDRPAGRPVVFGSVKSNIGHTESAAGVAGVIKTALAMTHRTIPANLHIKRLNPALAAASFPIEVRQEPAGFPVPEEPVIAGVSGFSFGGTNAHVVMEEAPPCPEPQSDIDPERVHILPLSAASPGALEALARDTAALLGAAAPAALADVAYTAARRRSHLEHRLCVAGRTHHEIQARLLAAIGEGDSEASDAAALGQIIDPAEIRIAFVYSGQGSEWEGMAADLYTTQPAFRAAIDALEPHFVAHAGWSLVDLLTGTAGPADRTAIDVVQPLIFAVQTALTALWRDWGIVPSEVLGQSMGEVAAAHASGALSAEDAVRVIVLRSRLMRTRSGAGATAVIGLGEAETRRAIAPYTGALDVAGFTSFDSTVIAGDAKALDALFATLEAEGVFCRLLETIEIPAHSPVMDDLVPDLVTGLQGIAPRAATIPFISTVTASAQPGETLDPAYWGQNLRKPFRVADAVSGLGAKGTTVFVEISPHPVAAGALRQCFGRATAEAVVLRSLTKHLDGPTAMASALGALHVAGVPVDWARFTVADARLTRLPSYPWQRERHWIDTLGKPVLYHTADGAGDEAHPLLGRQVDLAQGMGAVFQRTLDRNSLGWIAGHKLAELPVLPGAAYLEMATSAGRAVFGWAHLRVADTRFEQMLVLEEGARRRVQTLVTPRGADRAEITIQSRPHDAPDAPWTLHACAMVQRGESDPTPSLTAARTGVAQALEPFYDGLRDRGLVYGGAFRGLRSLQLSEGSARAEIDTPRDAKAYALHPAALDCAFQTLAALVTGSEADKVYLPAATGTLSVFGPTPLDGIHCHAQIVTPPSAASGVLIADLVLTDRGRAPFAEVQGLVLRRLEETENTDRLKVADYRLAWVDAPAAQELSSAQTRWVIAADRRGTAAALADRLRATGASVDLVPAEAAALVAELQANPTAGLVLIADQPIDMPPAEAARAQCAQALTAVQAMIGRSTPLWIVTRGAQVVETAEAPTLAQAPLWGFGRILAIEHPELCGGLIDLDPSGTAEAEAEALLYDLLGPQDHPQIAHRGARRLSAQLTPIDAAQGGPTVFRPDCGYLITGGLTGLGFVTARWMAGRGARHFLMLARTPLPPRQSWGDLPRGSGEAERVAALRALEAAGASVEIASIDVADQAALEGILANWQAELRPPLRGIIHAAGTIEDKLLNSMTMDAFETVMRPKVDGSLALDAASRALDLDFFVTYSSATAIMGQIGQANYAAANAFEDAVIFDRRARGLPATTLNWGPWAEAGLYARRNLKDQADIVGVGDILPEEGLAALDRAMAENAPQAIVVKADWQRAAPSPLTAHLTGSAEASAPDAGDAEDVFELLLMAPEERQGLLATAVTEMVAAVLKLEPDQIFARRPIMAYGMDSIMAVELRNRIRSRFAVAVPMVKLFTGTAEQIAEALETALLADEGLAALLEEVENLPEDAVAEMLSGAEEDA